MSGRMLPGICVLLSLLVFGQAAVADVIHLEDGGKHRGTITRETRRAVTIKTGAGTVVVPRDEISKIVREQDDHGEFLRRAKKLRRKDDADAWVRLGKWARAKGLKRDARRSFSRAVKIDGYHEEARRALGHRQYQGRWYSASDYEQVSKGLVKYQGQWVSAEDKERLERGLIKTPAGRWVDPEAKPEPKRQPPTSVPAGARRWTPRSPSPKKASSKSEGTAWYYDNARACDFPEAPEIESKHYKIKTNVKPEYARRYGKMMDRYFKKFLKVFGEFLPRGDLPKGTIWIYASRDEFRAAEGVGPTTGGFYQTGSRRVTAFHGPFGNSGHTREVLAHEGTHQFEDFVLMGRGFRNCPIWILEGLAVLFESAVYDGKEVVIGRVPQDRLQSLKRGLATGTLIPLDRLIRTPQSSFTAYHYAHAWSLIYMILYSSESKSVRKRTQQWFADLFTAAKVGPVTPAMVVERCGGQEKFADLERRWKAFIRDLAYDYDPQKR